MNVKPVLSEKSCKVTRDRYPSMARFPKGLKPIAEPHQLRLHDELEV